MLPEYISPKYLAPFITDEIKSKVLDSITYKSTSGSISNGIRATVLPEICDIWVQAKQKGALETDQFIIADNAYNLLRAFASVGIIALVDGR